MKYLICGGRRCNRQLADKVQRWVRENLKRGDTLIHGDARGVDSEAALAGQTVPGCIVVAYPADWDAHGAGAGRIRNGRMLREGKPDIVVAFEGGYGTADMVEKAKAAGVRILRP